MQNLGPEEQRTYCSFVEAFSKRFSPGKRVNLYQTQLRIKIVSLGRQEPQPAGTAKWPTTFRFGKILRTASVLRSIENPQDVLQKIPRP